jgi:hypothetical protein
MSAWFLDSGATHHMKEAQELFSILTERDLNVRMKLGDDAKYAVKGEGTFSFYLESRVSFDAHDVLYIPGLNKNLLSALIWHL